MKRSPAFIAGLAICTLLGVIDVVGLAAVGVDNGPPVAVTIAGAALGIITLIGAFMIWRGNRGGLITIVASRVLSVLLGVPVFFVSDAPSWARIFVAIAIVLTIAGVWLLFTGARRAHLPGAAQPSH